MAISPQYETFFRNMKIIHLGLLLGLMTFIVVIHFVLLPPGEEQAELGNIFRYLIPGLAIISIFASRSVANGLLKQLATDMPLSDKLNHYRSASIIRWAAVEGVALFAVVGYLLTGLPTLVLVALALAAYLFTLRPTAALVATELQLDTKERIELTGKAF